MSLITMNELESELLIKRKYIFEKMEKENDKDLYNCFMAEIRSNTQKLKKVRNEQALERLRRREGLSGTKTLF